MIEEIEYRLEEYINPLKPYAPWSTDIIDRVINSKTISLENLKNFGRIIKWYSHQLHQESKIMHISAIQKNVSLFHYFGYEDTNMDDLQLLLEYTDLATLNQWDHKGKKL